MTTLIVIGVIIVIILIAVLYNSKQTEEFVLTEEFKDILNILENSNDSVFISGKAGTGKSTLLKYFVGHTKKKYVIVAPTGVAAMNVKGQTIHSFFRFPPKLIQANSIQPEYARNSLFQNLQIMVIDEVSMISANLMDGIDKSLRINRNKPNIPFGGVQMVFIGDLFQLPPVVKSDLQQYFNSTYGGPYFLTAQYSKQTSNTTKKNLRIYLDKRTKILNRY